MKNPAQKAFNELLEKRETTRYQVHKDLKGRISRDKLYRISNGTTQSLKDKDIKLLSEYFGVPAEVFTTGNISIKGIAPAHPYNKLPDEIQEFITFYYITNDSSRYSEIFAVADDPVRLKARVAASVDTSYKEFIKDLDTLAHNPGKAESVINKLLERSYILTKDKKKYD